MAALPANQLNPAYFIGTASTFAPQTIHHTSKRLLAAITSTGSSPSGRPLIGQVVKG